MARIELQGPDSHHRAPATREETNETGWSFKRVVDALNTMLAELYGLIDDLANDLAEGFTVSPEAVSLDRALKLKSYTVATAPSASDAGAGAVIYVTDGDEGSACIAASNGTDWLVLSLGSAISATS